MTDGQLTSAVIAMTVSYVGYHLGSPELRSDVFFREALAALSHGSSTAQWGDTAARWLVSTLTTHDLTLWAARVRAVNGLAA